MGLFDDIPPELRPRSSSRRTGRKPAAKKAGHDEPIHHQTTPGQIDGAAGVHTILYLHFDGGSRGNPGPAGCGASLTTPPPTSRRVYEVGDFLGTCTNNVAEYTGLLRGLEAACVLGAKELVVKADSELIVRQLNGIYRVKSPDLKPLYEKALSMMRKIGKVTVSHVYREHNSRADALANAAMDSQSKVEPLGPLSPP